MSLFHLVLWELIVTRRLLFVAEIHLFRLSEIFVLLRDEGETLSHRFRDYSSLGQKQQQQQERKHCANRLLYLRGIPPTSIVFSNLLLEMVCRRYYLGKKME